MSAFDAALRNGLGLTVWACSIGLLIIPLAINPEAYYDAFVSPKWFWLAAMVTLGFAALSARALLGVPLRIPISPIILFVFVFLIFHLASVAWARSPSLALERTRRVAFLSAGMVMILQAVRTRRALLGMTWLWLAVAVATALWVLGQDALRAWRPDRMRIVSNLGDWRGYLTAGLGNTNHVGDLLALALLPAMIMLGETRRRWPMAVLMAGAVVLAAGLTVCYSVGSNVGLILGAGVMLALVWRRERLRFFTRRPRRWLALAALWAAMLAFFIVDHPANPHRPGILRQGFASERWKEGGPTRLVIWAGGLGMVALHPWIGVGAGNFTYVYPEIKSPLIEGKPELLVYQGRWTNAAHNVLLQSWSELGIGGLFVFLALIITAFHSLLAGLQFTERGEFLIRAALAGMLSAYLAQAMMNFSLQQPAGAMTFYLILTAVVVERATRRRKGKMPALVWESGWLRLRVDWITMKQPTSIGLAFAPPRPLAHGGAICVLVGAVAIIPWLHRTVRAQSEYGRAVRARMLHNPTGEEKFLLRALEIDPDLTDARSRYSQFLVERNTPEAAAEALKQLREVRKRLNSSELWEREAKALWLLGRKEDAARAHAVYRGRINADRP